MCFHQGASHLGHIISLHYGVQSHNGAPLQATQLIGVRVDSLRILATWSPYVSRHYNSFPLMMAAAVVVYLVSIIAFT